MNSFVNMMMAAGADKPSVERGCTFLYWTDRKAYFVNRIEGKSVFVERAKAVRTDDYGMSDSQCYKYERNPDAHEIELRWMWGKWREKVETRDGKTHWIERNVGWHGMSEYYDYSF